jgi:uncharacterized protein YjhX (UPF0386 family)
MSCCLTITLIEVSKKSVPVDSCVSVGFDSDSRDWLYGLHSNFEGMNYQFQQLSSPSKVARTSCLVDEVDITPPNQAVNQSLFDHVMAAPCVQVAFVFPGGFLYHGNNYVKKSIHQQSNGQPVGYYRCKRYRKGCSVTLKMHDDGQITISNMPHRCGQNGLSSSANVGEIYDAKEEMKKMVETRCLTDAARSVAEVAIEIFEEIHHKYAGKDYPLFFCPIKPTMSDRSVSRNNTLLIIFFSNKSYRLRY